MLLGNTERVLAASSNPKVTATAFDLAYRYLQAAENQIDRIWAPTVKTDDKKIPGAIQQERLVEVHFYFIALRDVYRFLDTIVKDEAFQDECLRKELDCLYNNWFKGFKKGRDTFEHIDDRLRGDHGGIKEIEENGAKRCVHFGISFKRGTFSHSDWEVDITKPTFEQIKTDVEKLLGHVVDCAANRLVDGKGS